MTFKTLSDVTHFPSVSTIAFSNSLGGIKELLLLYILSAQCKVGHKLYGCSSSSLLESSHPTQNK